MPEDTRLDILTFADDQARVEIPSDYRRSGQEYRDFRAVLINGDGSEIQRKRVLTRVFHWGSLLAPVHEEGDPYATHVRVGAQQLCQRILMALNTVPKTTKDNDDG